MTNLTALVERVESGSGGDRSIDTEIWRLFMGGHPTRAPLPWEQCYTSSLDAAVALVERVLPGWFWRVGHGSHAGPWAHLNRVHPDSCLPEDEATSYAKSPARALLAATLRALQSKEATDV